MNVKTSSEQPHTRSPRHPYTSVSLKVSRARTDAEQAQRNQEMEFLWLVTRAMCPKVRLNEVNKALRSVVAHYNEQPELPLEKLEKQEG